MNDDLNQLSREQLIAEISRLRAAIREHRDQSIHELCWYQPKLWSLLPDAAPRQPVVPEWPQFLEGCLRFRRSLDEQAPDAPRTAQPYPR
jgi:hypothetical protein